MLTWLAPIIVFGLVVFVHELGHFLAAKAVGVYAPRFSIGFGPALWRRRFGETEYILAALPLGGYVRMASREDQATAFLEGGSEEPRRSDGSGDPAGTDAAAVSGDASGATADAPAAHGKDWDPNALKPFGPRDVPAHRWFESKPLVARLFILIAGVTMNVVLALVVSVGIYAGYGRPYTPTVVDSVLTGRPAAAAGIRAGDSIVAVNGESVSRWVDLVERVGRHANQEITLDIIRGGTPIAVRVRPELTEVENPFTGSKTRVGRIGAAPVAREAREHVSFPQAVVYGWDATWAAAAGIVTIVKGLFSGGVSPSQLGGPIAIARVSVEAAQSGLEPLLALIAFLSINVAVLNMLPVPILDGGQILLNVLEAAKGSAFSERTREYILRAGLLAILLLFVLVMFNDIKGLAELFG